MKFTLLILVFISLFFTGCNKTTKESKSKSIVQEIKTQEKSKVEATKIINKEETQFFNEQFKYGHIKSFTPNSYKSNDLKLIDSTYFVDIIKQIESFSYNIYEPEIGHRFISKQHDIGKFRAETVSLNWGLCYEAIELLIIDQNDSLVNHLSLTEWRSTCESSSNTTTKFLNDSTFIKYIRSMEPGVDVNYFTELKYKALINHHGQLDTLEILLNKEYEEEIKTPHNNG